MKKILIITLLLSTIIFLYSASYQRDQVAKYAKRYTSLTSGQHQGYAPDYAPDSLWWNVNPFIYYLEKDSGAPENNAGYIDGTDCAHFVSQCLQAGYIPMYEESYSDDPNYLGYVNAKNLNLFAVNILNTATRDSREDYNYCVFYPDSIYLEEVFNPPLESAHPYLDNMYIFRELSFDIMKAQVYFDTLDLHQGHELEIDTASLPDLYLHPWNNEIHFWSNFIGQYENHPLAYLNIRLNVSYPLGPNYGFKLSKIRWRGADKPETSYHTGDFQIFCKYRASSTYEHQVSEIHYNNDYNSIGRMIRYRHAAICNADSGEDAKISYHSNDRYNKTFHCYIADPYHAIIFYEVPDNYSEIRYPNLTPSYDVWDGKPLITVHSKTDTINVNYFNPGDSLFIKFAFQNTYNIMIPDRFMVKVEKGENHSLVDSVLYNGIYSLETKVDTVDNYIIMPNIDSLRITVKLDAGDNQDYGETWKRTWNEQTWIESHEDDNEFSKMIYTKIPKVTNIRVNLNNNRGTINIQWDGDSSLIYKIYSSTNPNDEFEEDLSGTFNGNSWEAPQPSENKFYYIIATDGRNSKKSKSIRYLKRKGINRKK